MYTIHTKQNVKYGTGFVACTEYEAQQNIHRLAEGGIRMKSISAIAICILTVLFSACIVGDEITNYVIDRDGSISFAIYRANLTSDQIGKKGEEELANYLRNQKEKRDSVFTQLVKANATNVKISVLRKASPASVLITGRIPSLNDFAAYINAEELNGNLDCKAISSERTRRLVFDLTPQQQEKDQTDSVQSRADAYSEIRVSLAEGIFTSAQGFTISKDKRSALLDMEGLTKMMNSKTSPIMLFLEWQIPQTR
jgi:hypothetical protein